VGDRIPIATIPGLISPWVGSDIRISPAGSAFTIERVFLQRTDAPGAGGVVTASVRNATGGGGDGIELSIVGTKTDSSKTGSVTVGVSEAVYVRVSAADSESMNLRGWFEITGGSVVTGLLTTLVRVKRELGITGSEDDGILNELIESVTGEIQGALRCRFIQTTATSEKQDSIGDYYIPLDHYPVVSIASVSESSNVLVADTDYEATEQDKAAGRITRLASGDPATWAAGKRVVEVTYDYGYASVPDAIVQAATELAAYDYQTADPGGRRLGLNSKVLSSGGDASYSSREELWNAQRSRFAAYIRSVF